MLVIKPDRQRSYVDGNKKRFISNGKRYYLVFDSSVPNSHRELSNYTHRELSKYTHEEINSNITISEDN